MPAELQVKSVKEYPIQIEKKTTGVQVKEMVILVDAEEIKPPEITSSKQVQTEWSCAIYQMMTTSEQSLFSYLNGRKHKAKSEELKTFKQTPKTVPRSEQSADQAAEPKQILYRLLIDD
ncbi:hypothetical protein HAX54_000960 [Datura stramonium]|uniref:Uncharacterized protein n=1 Tax=Datura stramonium TaxID=4076 RepID=A0ABS8T2C7_DATST|nr:hypothetical protein [Datura stramonium]